MQLNNTDLESVVLPMHCDHAVRGQVNIVEGFYVSPHSSAIASRIVDKTHTISFTWQNTKPIEIKNRTRWPCPSTLLTTRHQLENEEMDETALYLYDRGRGDHDYLTYFEMLKDPLGPWTARLSAIAALAVIFSQ